MQKLSYFPGQFATRVERLFGIRQADLLDLSNNTNPCGASPLVRDYIIKHVDQVSRYPEDTASSLKLSIAKYVNSSVGQIVLGSGSAELLQLIAKLHIGPRRGLVISEYAYSFYTHLAALNHAPLTTVKRIGRQLDLNNIIKAVGPDTGLVIIANPGNPIASWLTLSALRDFLNSLAASVIIVVDEAYFEYMDEPGYESALVLQQDFPNLIISRTFSKLFGLAGLRLGYVICAPEVADRIERWRTPYNVGCLALQAGVLALMDDMHIDLSLKSNKQGMDAMIHFCGQHSITIVSQQANFITLDFGAHAYFIF